MSFKSFNGVNTDLPISYVSVFDSVFISRTFAPIGTPIGNKILQESAATMFMTLRVLCGV